ncbi:TolC family protein [Alistipes provencensis]|uniref:TolC family protein n=1 Tax=Alistipes provencensis TaxID=1816676 RepID=UPI0007EC5B2D|nr:TolC family protein [Alistipes provencensis]
MKKYIILIAVLALTGPVAAQQPIDAVLQQIERNNTTLEALRKQTEADKLQNKTGITLPDPEVSFDYLWGDPSSIGNRKDFGVSQSFDIATIAGSRRRVADAQNGLLDVEYRAGRMAVLLEAKQACIQLIYYNALKAELEQRLAHAQAVADFYDRQLADGNANRLEVNKARLSLSAAQGELRRNEVERANLLSELQRLNGGEPIAFDQAVYAQPVLPQDFEAWYDEAAAANPALAYARQNVELKRREMKLGKLSGLPQISAGYMSELVPESNFRGITLGLSVPLWSNRNRVKQAKAAVVAAELQQKDATVQFYERLRNQYDRTLGLQRTAGEYRKALAELDNTQLLRRALDAGEISLLDYIVELGLYYTTVDEALAAERDYELALTELQSVML